MVNRRSRGGWSSTVSSPTTSPRSASTSTATRSSPSSAPQSDNGAKFIIWDTDGNLGESILSHVYIKEAAAALIVGDVTRRTTLETMVQLGHGFMDAMPGRYCGFLVNKSDLASASLDLPTVLVQSSIPMIRTSAKTGENVKNAFLRAADAIRRRGL